MAHNMRRGLCALLAALILLTMMPAALAEGYSAYFISNTKVYASASTSAQSLNVKKGTKATITAIKGDWARVERGGVTAYCPVKYLNLSTRIKGYTSKETKIYASASKSSKSMKLGVNTEVYIIGRSGDYYRVQNEAGSVTGYVLMSAVSGKKVKTDNSAPESGSSWKDSVVMMDWFDGGNKVVSRGSYATIYDIQTGISFKVKRMGGTNHADMEPATAEDTAKLYKIVGGEYSWDSRPVILVKGDTYVACAINTLPHGDQTISDNYYDGQFCLHMVNSRTHGSDSVNESHQKAIVKAYNWAHS